MKYNKILLIRYKNGLLFFDATPPFEILKLKETKWVANKEIKEADFSQDGRYFFISDNTGLYIYDCDIDFYKINEPLFTFNHKNIKEVIISPLSNFVTTFTDLTKDNKNNIQVIKLQEKSNIKSFSINNVSHWHFQWSKDEKYFTKYMDDNLQICGFYDPLSIEKPIAKTPTSLIISHFSISPRLAQTYLATFTKGNKDMPCQLKLLQYPDFLINQYPSKNFFDGDECQFFWSNTGLSVLALITCQVDKTNESYYGKQSLFLLSARKDGFASSFSNFDNPIYSLAWRPQPIMSSTLKAQSKMLSPSKEFESLKYDANTNPRSKIGNSANTPEMFVVVYGKMPSKASLLNEEGDTLFDFNTGNRNGCFFSPQGHLLSLTGSGNIHGNIEFWEIKTGRGDCKLINKLNFTKLIPTFFAWCPDGEHMLIATTSPRLRMENGFSLYHYTGSLIYRSEEITELYDLKWRPPFNVEYPAKEIDYKLAKSDIKDSNQNSHIFVTEKPQVYIPPHLRNPNLEVTVSFNNSKKEKSKTEMKPAVIIPSSKDCIKRVRNIRKRIKQIKELKEDLKSGKKLDQSQIEKIASETKLIEELRELALSLSDEY